MYIHVTITFKLIKSYACLVTTNNNYRMCISVVFFKKKSVHIYDVFKIMM